MVKANCLMIHQHSVSVLNCYSIMQIVVNYEFTNQFVNSFNEHLIDLKEFHFAWEHYFMMNLLPKYFDYFRQSRCFADLGFALPILTILPDS